MEPCTQITLHSEAQGNVHPSSIPLPSLCQTPSGDYHARLALWGHPLCAAVLCCCVRLCDPMDGSLLGSSIRGLSRQEYWGGLPFPPPRDLPNPGTEPVSPALQVDSLPLSHWGSPHFLCTITKNPAARRAPDLV